MWVEADTNITGEEALIRQLLYGIRFFQEEFGIRVRSMWLPDVFGYSGNLPQIIRKSGLDYFMTIKLSWNDTNAFPYHSFNWQGIDGSVVLAHMPPEGEYNSPADAKYLLKGMNAYHEKNISRETMCLFGVGDGGGGPSDSHIERIRRLGGCPPMPKVKMAASEEYFRRLADIRDKLPVYRGELYLEKHRGTYTSQGRVKYWNRRLEQKLKTLETLLVQLDRYQEFKSEIQLIWKEVLLYQFHDILPGSSIKRVYDECLVRYQCLDERIDGIVTELMGFPLLNKDEVLETCIVYNPLAEVSVVERLTDTTYQEFHMAPMSTQVLHSNTWEKSGAGDRTGLENALLKVTFSRDGSIKEIYDKEQRLHVLCGGANQYRVFKDIANAWDIDRHYRRLPSHVMKLVKSEGFSYGPVQGIVQQYQSGDNELVVSIRLKPGSRRIDFDVKAKWKSTETMLRTAFPLNLQTDEAFYDIQFGHIARSTGNRTKTERAQYEACGQQWVDMNDGRWGVALLTDSKYGFRTKDSCIDVNLIKSTDYPAEHGDIGCHAFRYGLYIHKGSHIEAGVDRQAMEFNTWFPVAGNGIKIITPLMTLDNENITYSTVKSSEAGDDLVVRLYERNGRDCSCTVTFSMPIAAIYETNLVEEGLILLSETNAVELEFSPFEVKTLCVRR